MNTSNCNDLFREKVQTVLKEYKLTLKTLSKVTGIDYVWLTNYVNSKSSYGELSLIDMSTLSTVLILLTDGMKMINDDERVKSVIDILVNEFEIKLETLAIYAGLKIDDVDNFMKDTNSISYEKKYKLATKTLSLNYIFKQPSKIET